MKKLLTISIALVLICAYVFAAPQAMVNTLYGGDPGDEAQTNTLVFTARGANLRIYTSAGDVVLITPNYTNSAVFTAYPKFAGTTALEYKDIFAINSLVSLKMTATDTNTIYFLIYND